VVVVQIYDIMVGGNKFDLKNGLRQDFLTQQMEMQTSD
jgi:hypothetical protein